MSRSSPVQDVVVPAVLVRLLRWWTCAPVNEPSVTVPFSTMNPSGLTCPFILAVNEMSPTVIHSVKRQLGGVAGGPEARDLHLERAAVPGGALSRRKAGRRAPSLPGGPV
jgi:hypothetical protein